MQTIGSEKLVNVSGLNVSINKFDLNKKKCTMRMGHSMAMEEMEN